MSNMPNYGAGYFQQLAPVVAAAGPSRSYARLGLMLGIGGLSVAAVAGVTYLLTGDSSATAADTSGDSHVSVDETNQRPKVVLHQCPRGYTLPCISPFPLKLETFLRVAGIPYEVRISSDSDSAGRDPWLTVGEESAFQTYECVPLLSKVFGINLEEGARGSRLTASRLVGVMLENRLYWGIAIWRWIYDKGASLSSVQPVFPPEASGAVIAEVSESVRRAAFYNGLGRRPFEEVIHIISRDLADLSAALGKHPFFLGETPGEIDCTAFAMLAQILWAMPNCPFQPELQKYPNLCEFLTRMRDNYWKDWNAVLAKPGDAVGFQSFYPVNEFNIPTAELEDEFEQTDYQEIDSEVYRNYSAVSTPARGRSRVAIPKRALPQVQFEQESTLSRARSQVSSATVGEAESSMTQFDDLKQKVDVTEEPTTAKEVTPSSPVESRKLTSSQAQTSLQETPAGHQAKQVANFNQLKAAQNLLDTLNQRMIQKNEKPVPVLEEVVEHEQPKPQYQQSPAPNLVPNNNQVFYQPQQQQQPLPLGSFHQNSGMPQQQQQYLNPQQPIQYAARSRPPMYYGNVGLMRGVPSRPDVGGLPTMGMGMANAVPVHYAPVVTPQQPVYYNDFGLPHQGMIPIYQNPDMTIPVQMQQQQHQYFQQQQLPQYIRK